jgi:DNA-directed RNA polymerase omega subunit
MFERDQIADNALSDSEDQAWGQGIDSRFRLIVVASLRNKQLCQGSKPRIEMDSLKRRTTSIAVEEVKRGLVPFSVFPIASVVSISN